MGVIAYIVIGLAAGFAVRALLPGRRSLGFLASALLGMTGATLAGIVGGAFLSRTGEFYELQPGGVVMAVLGALASLYAFVVRHRRVHI